MEAFRSFTSNTSLLALPLRLKNNVLQDLPFVHGKDAETSFQINLNLLDGTLNPRTSLYLLLRRSNSILAITFVPHQAPGDERELYLEYRHNLVGILGEEHFKMSLICKEVGEITDARSWDERDAYRQETGADEHTDVCEDSHEHSAGAKDAGYKKNKCRLCDRRMKNKITDETLEALKKLENEGSLVMIVCPCCRHEIPAPMLTVHSLWTPTSS